jgi:hypothetical protein
MEAYIVEGAKHQASAAAISSTCPTTDAENQNWYWVSALYKAVHLGTSRKRHLWERTVFLIRAAGEADAACIAKEQARAKEQEYVAAGGDTIRWVFQEVEQIHELFDREMGQGTEVYWEFFERVDGSAHVPRRSRQRGLKPRA